MSFCSVVEIAGEVRAGRVTARAVTEATLSRIERLDGGINAFTAVTAASPGMTTTETPRLPTASRIAISRTRGIWFAPEISSQ